MLTKAHLGETLFLERKKAGPRLPWKLNELPTMENRSAYLLIKLRSPSLPIKQSIPHTHTAWAPQCTELLQRRQINETQCVVLSLTHGCSSYTATTHSDHDTQADVLSVWSRLFTCSVRWDIHCWRHSWVTVLSKSDAMCPTVVRRACWLHAIWSS